MLLSEVPPAWTVLVRTDFSDAAAWRATVEAGRAETPEGFQAIFTEVDDPDLRDATVPRLVELLTPGRYFVLAADERTMRDPEHLILVVDLDHEPGRTFRVASAKLYAVENNLSLSNMRFAEFADKTDEDGVFRGF